MKPSVIDRALEGLSITTHIHEADACLSNSPLDLLERLENAGCGAFRDENQNKRVQLFMERL